MIKTRILRQLVEKTLFLWLKDSPIEPKHLLIGRFMFSLLTSFVLLLGNFYSIIFITAYQLVFLLDYIDGKIARYRKIFSQKWRKVDRIFHYITSSMFLFSITYGFSALNISIFLIGLVGVFSILLTTLLDSFWINKTSFDNMLKVHENKGIFTKFYSFLSIESSFSLFFFFIIFNLKDVAIVFFSAISILKFIKKIGHIYKWKKNKLRKD